MDTGDLLQWPAMAVTVAGAWLLTSTSRRRRFIGFGIIPDGCVQGLELGASQIRDLKVARTIRLMYRPQHPSLATEKMVEWLRKLRST